MKKISLFGMALLIALAVSCKQYGETENATVSSPDSKEAPAEEVAPAEEMAIMADSTNVNGNSVKSENNLSSSAAVTNNDGKRKFVRTADIRFKVRNVAQSTTKVEDAVSVAGGFVVNTDLKSDVRETRDVKKSEDSIVRTTVYTVRNDMVIRVPNYNLDATLKNISKEVGYLDYRIIKAEDVNLQLKSTELEQKRLARFKQRVEGAVDNKGKKLVDINDTEENLLAKQETSDAALLKKMELEDKIAYSTVALQLYQDEAVKSVTLANLDSAQYRTGFGTQAWDSLKSGWYILEAILVFALNLWPFILIGTAVFVGWKKLGKKKVAV
ncbi:DUF4349 domain-containing protein [Flavobacterium sp. MAH-1]|uniref:DUF4349 domain-containing protein n=1 Tax=Flavobacterium agri TaxID=2743471 RepID=A0A7Y8XZ38_9FLAO|nr:DUF4349 domain-containing protein [Flavobacterium agri]NUY79571.1 DUF4349 domain-containing protein [Flavobacterium agri]NYA69596.1 DUF4349 domain-containing protein [Flavobacterium agri]